MSTHLVSRASGKLDLPGAESLTRAELIRLPSSADILVPAPGLRRFVEGDALDFSAPFVWSVDGLLTPDECGDLVERIETLGPESAPITTAQGFVMNADVRNNTRVMFDDHRMADRLFERARRFVPGAMNGGMSASGLNERWRCYRYEPGQRFAPHYDGSFRRSDREESLLTMIIYLNQGFEGGRTEFPDMGVSVEPVIGRALFFQHRLLHESTPLVSGRKYAARSDVMYRRPT